MAGPSLITHYKNNTTMMQEQQFSGSSMSRRGFLKRTALAGAAVCLAPTLDRVQAAEQVFSGRPSGDISSTNGMSGMAAVQERRVLGSGCAAMTVSALGFGCMGLTNHRSAHPSKEQEIALVHAAIERGVTLFDTAESYGYHTNELLMGEALRGYTDRVFVTSKFGHKFVNGVQIRTEEDSTPANIRRVCENSLRNLGVETLGMFYQHRVDPNTPIEVVAETCRELMREGKILHWGICEVSPETIRRAHAVCPLTAVQSEYHLMYRAVETNGVLAVCEELGIGFVPYSPLNRGFLGGCLNEYTVFDADNDNRPSLPRFQPEAMRQNTRVVEVLNRFGRTRGLTSAQVALAYLMNKAPWIVPIPGTTRLAHLEEDLRATEVRFTAAEMQELVDAVSAIPVIGNRYDALQQSKIDQ